MTGGAIEGGWNFVWAAYGATWIFFAAYTASLFLRGTAAPTSGGSTGNDEEQP